VDADALWPDFADHLARLYGPVGPVVERGPAGLPSSAASSSKR
jgi:hypothetical protein